MGGYSLNETNPWLSSKSSSGRPIKQDGFVHENIPVIEDIYD